MPAETTSPEPEQKASQTHGQKRPDGLVPVVRLGTVPVSGVMKTIWYRYGLEHTF